MYLGGLQEQAENEGGYSIPPCITFNPASGKCGDKIPPALPYTEGVKFRSCARGKGGYYLPSELL